MKKPRKTGPIAENPWDELVTPIVPPLKTQVDASLTERALFLKGEDWRSITDRRELSSCSYVGLSAKVRTRSGFYNYP